MSSVYELIKVFSEQYQKEFDKCSEDFYTLSIVYQVNSLKEIIPPKGIDYGIPQRDVLSIYFYETTDDDDLAIKYNSSLSNWAEFFEEYANLDKSTKRLVKIDISKKVGTGVHSIYDHKLFYDFMKTVSPFSLLGQLSQFAISGKYTFEWQEDNRPLFMTSMFNFLGKGKKITHEIVEKSMEERQRCISKARFLCSSSELFDNILPDDLFPIISEDTFLDKIFKNLSTLYSFCFLCDSTHIKGNEFVFKLNGFKSISGRWPVKQNFDEATNSISNRIYLWGYQGGDIDDKILIIRNILSLNLDLTSVSIHPNTFDAILSNYKIYQKENVRQYLDLRNNIVRDIQKHQDSILHAIDSFEDAFKKISISLLSFFFITVILTILSFVLSSKRFIPDAVLFCCLAISIISLLYYYKERRWLNERILQLEYQFKNSKKYYEDLLGKEELKNFFENENEIGVENKNFHDKKIKEISNLWKISTWVIVGFLILALLINHFHPLQEIIQLLSNIFNNLTSSPDAPAT